MNLPLVIESIHELRDRQASREQKIIGFSVTPLPVNRTAVLNVVGLSRRHRRAHTGHLKIPLAWPAATIRPLAVLAPRNPII